VRDGSNSLKYLWQSFDHPAHRWLPGSKLAFNKITNENQRLISWKNAEDPAPGLFSLELQPNTTSYIMLWNRSIQYWTSGPWDGEGFSLVPEMTSNYLKEYRYLYNFSFVDNTNETYFTYSLYDLSMSSHSVLDVSGQIKQITWLANT
jgi:hypothetical protein